jgi:hypothetical protein
MGCLIPSFEDVHYYFLLNTCNITLTQYDILCISPFIGIALGTMVYLKYLKNIEVWKLIVISLLLRAVVTVAQIANVKRLNLVYGISDFYTNLFTMFFDRASILCLCTLPMTVMLTYVIPKYVEATMFAIITACLEFSTAWGSDITGGILCKIYQIDYDNLKDRYEQVLVLKIPLIFFMLLMIRLVSR